MRNFKILHYLLILCLALMPKQAKSCINEYRTSLSGKLVSTEGGLDIFYGFKPYDKKALLEALEKAQNAYNSTKSLEDYSDLGAVLAYNGQYLKAKKIFEEIEKQKPGLYTTAANMGTVYELLGQNDLALYWIKKAVAINPHSHENSEWIHVKILEAKIKLASNPNYLQNHTVLSLDFGDDEIPVNKNKLKLDDLESQLQSQLYERMSFIKPKDAIVAQLLFDLGNVTAIITNVESALSVYKSAKEYGYSSPVLDKRMAHFEDLKSHAERLNSLDEIPKKLDKFEAKYPVLTMLIAALAFILMVVFLVFLFKKLRAKLKSKKTK